MNLRTKQKASASPDRIALIERTMSGIADSITRDDIIRSYQFYAPVYFFAFGGILEPGRRALSRELQTLRPASILEIGVGTGMLLDKYPITSKVTGIDICKDMLKIAQCRADLLPSYSIELMLMDAENLSFDDGRFDCVILPYVLSVTPDPDKLILEARRVCKKGGTIMILNHFSGSAFWRPLEKLVRHMAKKIGFRSEFSYKRYVMDQSWQVTRAIDVNLFGLSKFIVVQNT
jgi:phosphatidylethanolamine/phosphatidyl-N-methylethanolamine N-methyltransferase